MSAKPTLKLSTFRIGEKRKKGEGLRLGTVRFLPRGVRKADYARRDLFDVWFPLLAPSRELFRWYMSKPMSDRRYAEYGRRYRREMTANSDRRQALAVLAALARQTPIAIGCYCDTPHCHRFVLEQLIKEQAAAVAPGAAPGA